MKFDVKSEAFLAYFKM